MPTEALKQLDTKRLMRSHCLGAVGCPFSYIYGGPKSCGDWGLAPECKELCGKLFPKAYNPLYCPCWHMSRAYIKKVFWKKLNEAQPLGETTRKEEI